MAMLSYQRVYILEFLLVFNSFWGCPPAQEKGAIASILQL